MTVKLLTEHHLEFLSLKEGCTGSFESSLVKMPHCWKSHAAAHIPFNNISVISHIGQSIINSIFLCFSLWFSAITFFFFILANFVAMKVVPSPPGNIDIEH